MASFLSYSFSLLFVPIGQFHAPSSQYMGYFDSSVLLIFSLHMLLQMARAQTALNMPQRVYHQGLPIQDRNTL
jgi:hypothetical protein